MKLEDLALAAAELAESHGWDGVTSRAVAQTLKLNPVSVSRKAGLPLIVSSAREVVEADRMRYPRASIELQLGMLSHTQRRRIVHAIAKELAQ